MREGLRPRSQPPPSAVETKKHGPATPSKRKLALDSKRDERCTAEVPAEPALKIMREGLRPRRQPPPPAMAIKSRARGPATSKKMKLASDSKQRHEEAPTAAAGHHCTAEVLTAEPGLKNQENVPSAAGAQDQPKPRLMEAPPAGTGADGYGGGSDHISALPDELRGEILSLLPTKQGARTAILASGWRKLWRNAPLNLDCRGLGVDNVSSILSSHEGEVRRLCVDASDYMIRPADLDRQLNDWFFSPSLNNLQKLEFLFKPYYRRRQPAPPPSSTFRFSATLRIVTIGYCNLPEGTIQGLHFPVLKQLGLDRVSISEGSVRNMVARCLALECLLISECYGFRCLRVDSLSLKSIAVRNSSEFPVEELVIESAPRLETLLHLDWPDDYRDFHVSLLSVPKLETLTFTSPTSLVFGSTIIQGLHVDGPTALCTLKSLALSIPYKNLNLDTITGLLSCFPSLEKLYIWVAGWRKMEGQNNVGNRDLMECLDLRLKKVVVLDYRGRNSEVDIVRFFLVNARALESMTLLVGEGEDFVAKQRSKLQENRASCDARLHFRISTGPKFWDIKNVCDLDLIDPWE